LQLLALCNVTFHPSSSFFQEKGGKSEKIIVYAKNAKGPVSPGFGTLSE